MYLTSYIFTKNKEELEKKLEEIRLKIKERGKHGH